jgi:hypothetical protein
MSLTAKGNEILTIKGHLRPIAGPPDHGLQDGQGGQDSELSNRHRLAIPEGQY